jgi:hypothetical protein
LESITHQVSEIISEEGIFAKAGTAREITVITARKSETNFLSIFTSFLREKFLTS